MICDRCQHSSFAVTSIKYNSDLQKLTALFFQNKISLNREIEEQNFINSKPRNNDAFSILFCRVSVFEKHSIDENIIEMC